MARNAEGAALLRDHEQTDVEDRHSSEAEETRLLSGSPSIEPTDDFKTIAMVVRTGRHRLYAVSSKHNLSH